MSNAAEEPRRKKAVRELRLAAGRDLGGELELVGQLGPATSNVIIRAVGLDAAVEIEHNTIAIEHGDLYLLCCDGLSDLVDDWMIREIMTSGESVEAMADNLIRAANNNGGTDNITVILVQAFAETMWPAQMPYHQGYASY